VVRAGEVGPGVQCMPMYMNEHLTVVCIRGSSRRGILLVQAQKSGDNSSTNNNDLDSKPKQQQQQQQQQQQGGGGRAEVPGGAAPETSLLCCVLRSPFCVVLSGWWPQTKAPPLGPRPLIVHQENGGRYDRRMRGAGRADDKEGT
jgi:hypothetical protein